jgi:hypothetical protein
MTKLIKAGDTVLIEAKVTQVISDEIAEVKVYTNRSGWDECKAVSIWSSSIQEVVKRPMQIGDRIKSKYSDAEGVLKCIEGDAVWVLMDGERSPYTYSQTTHNFEVI